MSLADEWGELKDTVDTLVEVEAINLFNTLRLPAERGGGTPVDSGNLRASWQPMKKTGFASFRFYNSADYADIALGKRVRINGRWYGSTQLPDGIDPILAKAHEKLQKKLKALK